MISMKWLQGIFDDKLVKKGKEWTGKEICTHQYKGFCGVTEVCANVMITYMWIDS